MNELYVLLGVLGYILMHLAATKDLYDGNKKKEFDFKIYFKKSWDNWLFSLIGGFIVYYGFPFLWDIYFQQKGLTAPELVPAYAPISGFLGGTALQQIWNVVKKFTNGKNI